MDNTINELYFNILDESSLKSIAAAGLLAGSALTGHAQSTNQPISKVQQATKTPHINIDKIAKIESHNNPKAINSKTGARGVCQINSKEIWDEMMKVMNKNWTWEEDAFDGDKNKMVGQYYINVKIPKLLKHYKIPDSVETRLAAYNWGIGHLQKNYKKYGGDWIKVAPTETKNYIAKYKH